MESMLLVYADATLRRSLYNISNGKMALGKARLKKLLAQIEPLMSIRLKGLVSLAVSRYAALDLCLDGAFNSCIRLLNDAIYTCPLHRVGPVVGMSESLVLMADAYTATGRYEEAMHSVCLAMDFSAERYDQVWSGTDVSTYGSHLSLSAEADLH